MPFLGKNQRNNMAQGLQPALIPVTLYTRDESLARRSDGMFHGLKSWPSSSRPVAWLSPYLRISSAR